MSLVPPPPRKPSDDLDFLLRAFFRSQMPDPWPGLRLSSFRPNSARPATPSRRPLIRSRWALAASIGLLLIGSLLLPGRFAQDLKPESYPGGPHIGTNDLRRQMDKEHRLNEFENKNKPQLGADAPAQDFDDLDLPPIR
jgi:hypothetical protein